MRLQSAALLLGLAPWAIAQDAPTAQKLDVVPKIPPVNAVRLLGPIRVDGILDEAAWKSAAKIDTFFETVFGDNREPVVKTTAACTTSHRCDT